MKSGILFGIVLSIILVTFSYGFLAGVYEYFPYSELSNIKKAAKYAKSIGLEVHAGHGLNFSSAKKISKIKYIKEFNIGLFIVGESIFME